MEDPLDDIELWRMHTDGDGNAEKVLNMYREWKRENRDGGGRLNLYKCGLQSIPPEIGRLTSLKYLYCSFNELRELPQEIGGLTSLVELYCSKNELRELPPEIGRLTSLKIFNCSINELRELPLEIGSLTSLRSLYCFYNEFVEGYPTTIEALKERWLVYRRRCIKGAKA